MIYKSAAKDLIKSLGGESKRWWKRNFCLKPGNENVILSYSTDLNKVTFEKNAFIAHHVSILNAHIGNHTSIGRFSKIRNANIGKYCSISWDVTIGAVSHPLNTITTAALTYKSEYHLVSKDLEFPQKGVTVGNDVWIGCGVVILSGVSIGDGVIIGAGAVVTKDVLPYTIVGGCPARQIRMRVENQDMVKRLQNLAWWEWSESSLRDCLALFQGELDLHILEEFEKYKELMINENSGSNSCKGRF